jgi:hypothetical protein
MPSPAQHRPNFVLAPCIDHFVGKWVIQHGSCGSVDQDVRSAALGAQGLDVGGVEAKSPGLSMRHNNGQKPVGMYCQSFRAEMLSPRELVSCCPW